MASSWYNGFDAVIIDADGIPSPLANETFNVVALPSMISLGTATSDAFGHVPSGSKVVGLGTIIQFKHPSYPNTFNRTIAGTILAASLLLANTAPVFAAEDLRTGGREPVAMEITAEDLDDPTVPPVFIGYAGGEGTTTRIPFETVVGHNYRHRGNPIYDGGEKLYRRHQDIPTYKDAAASALGDLGEQPANYIYAGPTEEPNANPAFRPIVAMDLAPVLFPLWQAFEDFSNPTSDDDLHEGVIPPGLMATDGDRVVLLYAGSYAANPNEKYPVFKVDGNTIYSNAESPNGGFWEATITITRTDSDSARCATRFTGTAGVGTSIADISGLDFTTPIAVVCRGISDANNDITLKMTDGIYYAAVAEVSYVVDDDGALDVDDDGAFVGD